jgi:hypothetical protein
LGLALLAAGFLLLSSRAWAGQTESSQSSKETPKPQDSRPALPEAPQSQSAAHAGIAPAKPCPAKRADNAAQASGAAGASGNATPTTPAAGASGAASRTEGAGAQTAPCSPLEPLIAPIEPVINWYARFTNGPQVKPMTPKEKAWLALRNVADPFNGITILGSSAIAVGSNADSPYGPGMTGFGKYVGVSYAQDMTGEFIGTFLIPSIARQDPHYHRLPNATLKRRIAHAAIQVVWTQGDNGKGLLNYADVVGFAIDDEIGNLYIPGRETNLRASAERYGIDLATAPIDNFVTEFLPDVARRIHLRVVLIQRIINQVARTETANGQP